MSGLARLRPAIRCLAMRGRVPSRQASQATGKQFWWERASAFADRAEETSWRYRGFMTEHPKGTMYAAHAFMGVMWWWFLTHMYYQYDILLGHHWPPNPATWTDAELGIPAEGDD